MDTQSEPQKETPPDVSPNLPGYYADPPPYQPYASGSGAGPYMVQLPPNYPTRNLRYPPGSQVIQIQGSTVVTGGPPISVKPRPHVTFTIIIFSLLCTLFFIVPIILGLIFAFV